MTGYSVIRYTTPHMNIFNLDVLYPELDSYYFNKESAQLLFDYLEKEGVKGLVMKEGWTLCTAGMEMKSLTKEQIEQVKLKLKEKV